MQINNNCEIYNGDCIEVMQERLKVMVMKDVHC